MKLKTAILVIFAAVLSGCGGVAGSFTRERADGKIPVKVDLIRAQVRRELDGMPKGESEVARWQAVEFDYNACRLLSAESSRVKAEEVFTDCMSRRGYVYMFPIDAEQLHNDVAAELTKERDERLAAEKKRAEEERLVEERKRQEHAAKVERQRAKEAVASKAAFETEHVQEKIRRLRREDEHRAWVKEIHQRQEEARKQREEEARRERDSNILDWQIRQGIKYKLYNLQRRLDKLRR